MSPKSSKLPALLIAGAAGLVAGAAYDRLGRFEISEASMAPALRPGDYVLTVRVPGPPSRGEIVVFEHPDRPSFYLVKRIIGLPGERLSIERGRIHLDGKPLDEPWTTDETGPDGTWDLNSEEAFVLGDARWMSSGDSREIGPVPLEHINMRVVFRYWPLGRLGRVH